MEAKHTEVINIITTSLASGRGRADIELTLVEKGYDINAFSHHIETHLKQHEAMRRTQGQILIAIGILICFISCVATMVSGSVGNSTYMLVGLTTLGIVVLFAGLTMIF